MSIARGKFERRTILDFSQGKFSKNHIMKALRQVEVLERMETQDDITFIDNRIQVGMYQICIIPSSIVRGRRSKLRDYGPFTIEIMETQNDGIDPLTVKKITDSKNKTGHPSPIPTMFVSNIF